MEDCRTTYPLICRGKASREVLMEFAEESDDINEEHASEMRMYMNKKFSASSMVSYEHLGTF